MSLSNAPEMVDDLRRLIANRQIVVIVGSGVSAAATCGASTASWIGLLKSGIRHCELVVDGLPPGWGARQREMLDAAVEVGDLVDMLAVAEQVSRRLNAPRGAEYIRWLHESLDDNALPLKSTSVIQALVALRAPIVTTNYDDMIERVSGWPGVSWRSASRAKVFGVTYWTTPRW